MPRVLCSVTCSVFGHVFGVRSRVRCSVTFQAQCSCSFVFDTFEKIRVRVRSCSIIFGAEIADLGKFHLFIRNFRRKFLGGDKKKIDFFWLEL